ncbi:complement inhibitor CirpT3-like [Ornithodoros turicata]|uniref:complement inhibitor CirpT3-like n=1 Tax=Ornithodoros turicata TaxID=34597 RepID=UPI003138B4FF
MYILHCCVVLAVLLAVAFGAAGVEEVRVRNGRCVTRKGLKRDGEVFYDTLRCIEYECDAQNAVLTINTCPPFDFDYVGKGCTVLGRKEGVYPVCCEPLVSCAK